MLCFESLDQRIYFGRFESESVHARIDLEVNGVIRHSLSCCLVKELLEHGEAIHLGFEVVIDNLRQTVRFGVHHDDRDMDTLVAQGWLLRRPLRQQR